MNSFLCLLIVLIFVFAVVQVDAGMWGRKRRSEKDEVSQPSFDSFERRRQAAARGINKESYSMNGKGKSIHDQKKPEYVENISGFITTLEQMILSPEFETFLNPDVIYNSMKQIPNMPDNEMFTETLESMKNMNPLEIKTQLLLAFSGLKEMLNDLSDPQKISEALEEVPEEYRSIFAGILKGDLQPLKDRVTSEPLIEKYFKTIILDFLDGNFLSGLQRIKVYVKNHPEVIESIRQAATETNSDMTQFGLDSEIFTEPKFTNFIYEILDGLITVYGEQEQQSQTARKSLDFQ